MRPNKHIRPLFFLVVFAGVVLFAQLAGQEPLIAQSTDTPGDTLPPSPKKLYLPFVTYAETVTQPPRTYSAIEVEPPPTDRPADLHPDLNLAVRGFVAITDHLALVNYGGETDQLAPQIDGMFNPPRLPAFQAVYQVNDWDWGCDPPNGCLGAPISDYPVTLLEMQTTQNEEISIPRRTPSILDDYKALVLYASERRLTITYTRGDTAANGYLVQLEDFAVNPGLVALYQEMNTQGRSRLPALRNGDIIGMADRGSVKIATRDTGQYLDPRACKDWWNGYMDQCVLQLRRPK